MKSVYLISYDIKDERRLNRVHRYLKGRGIHLQKSVFYCLLSQEEIKKVRQGIEELIEEREDDVRIYPLLVEFETIAMGQGEKVPGGVWIYLD
jgi:CRISPR-associated protein Cas2